ncbi:Uncharacterised protein [Collinsella intestinalis]|nr:Uncharacterised protein [Collinsella intestinalis]
MTTSSVGIFLTGCISTGMPRPLSTTVIELSGWTVTSMLEQKPAMASSTELSTISHTRWCKPVELVEPIYIPGRTRTASRPSRTLISLPPYSFSFATWFSLFSVKYG